MEQTHKVEAIPARKFELTPSLRRNAYIFMGIGVVALLLMIILAASDVYSWDKIWANLLVNTIFLTGLGLMGVFFIAAHYIGLAGWHVTIKRVPEAMLTIIPVAGVLMLIVVIGTWFEAHDLYKWALPGHLDHNPHTAHKAAFLNLPFWSLRYVLYFGLWTLLAFKLRDLSLRSDLDADLWFYKKQKFWSAIFIVVFAVTSSTMAWDFLMSIDFHWYSTLYGWYTFSSYACAGIAMMSLIVVFLKRQGLLPFVNNEHLHDLGKFLFGFSIFWAYLWFSQYMLIWYGNIGEETVYFKQRLDHYPVLFFLIFFLNFFVPFFALMKRDTKRNFRWMVAIPIIVLFGHWLDFYLMVVPGGTDGVTFGWFEILFALGFMGLFGLVVMRALAKAPLEAVNDPFFKESVQHHT